ncbi:DUF4403 family protein [Bradyrhizobium sp. dw_411]|uniref:DUF4403 family protein n=1 Tax=Bradyrhizobium sp. dw_411 TaxID=2720082 RepID=UPI001BCD408F|nr:DUF4403 family protein [Bradyrhizobium sp. dw_411]
MGIYPRPTRNITASCFALLCAASFAGTASAGEKPPVIPDAPSALTTPSRVAATIEFGLPSIASAVERDVPRRLATIDERIGCVNKRVFVFRIKANCDVDGFVDRGAMSLYGRGDHIVGSIPIFGSIEGQGANRFTSRIHGDAEGRAMVEVESRPKLTKDWSIDLNFSDSFHWTEPPVLRVLGREISLTKYAEPSIRKQLGRIRAHAQEAARRLDLHDKAAKAWEQAFQPVPISQDPPVWLQIVPANAAFAGVHANAKDLSGSLELTGTAQTLIGQAPSAVTPTPLPTLGNDISQPGTFDILLPVRVNYDALRDKIMQAVASSKAGPIIKEMQIYPSSGKLVIGVRAAGPDTTDPAAGEWLYLSGALNVDSAQQSIKISNLAGDSSLPEGSVAAQLQNQLLDQLKDIPDIGYGLAYQNLLNAANERLNRPLKNGFRMEGQLTTAKLDSIQLLADGVGIALRVSGDLKILYGM